MIVFDEGFSASALMTFGAGSFFVVEGTAHSGSSAASLVYPLGASSSPSSCSYQKYLDVVLLGQYSWSSVAIFYLIINSPIEEMEY